MLVFAKFLLARHKNEKKKNNLFQLIAQEQGIATVTFK